MDAESELLKLIHQNGLTIEKVAELISDDNKKTSAKTLRKRFEEKKLRFNDVQKILDIIGYKLIIKLSSTEMAQYQ